jgi:hypothetical protein
MLQGFLGAMLVIHLVRIDLMNNAITVKKRGTYLWCLTWHVFFFFGHGENWLQNWRWLFNFWVIIINPYFVSSASDTVLQIFTFVPSILILSKFFVHQLMHKWVAHQSMNKKPDIFTKFEAKLNADALSCQTSHWGHESYWINSAKNTHWEAMLRIMAAKLTHLIQNKEMIELLVTECRATCQFHCWWWIWELADRLTQIVSTNICSHFLPRWHHQPSRSLQYIFTLKVNSTCICHNGFNITHTLQ